MFSYQKVKLLTIPKILIPVTEGNKEIKTEREMSADEFIAYAARVSNPANQMSTETAPKLIAYLIRNQHWSPFEMISLTMEIVTTRDIARQILRHRSFSFQEFSQRYAKVDTFTVREARLQDAKNRQNSVQTKDESLIRIWNEKQEEFQAKAKKLYDWAIQNGIAKEQARAVLPEGLTLSTLYMAGTLRSWIHYIQLREANGTQLEHQDIALKAKSQIIEHFPTLKDYLNA